MLRSSVSDDAADARKSGIHITSEYKNQRFHVVGTGHSHTRVGQLSVEGYEEIDLVEGLLLTGDNSLSQLVSTSERFRATFSEESCKDRVSAWKPLGWGAAAEVGRGKAYRFASRLRQAF